MILVILVGKISDFGPLTYSQFSVQIQIPGYTNSGHTNLLLFGLTMLVDLFLVRFSSVFKRLTHFTLVKEALIEIGCVVTSLVGWLSRDTRVHCGQTVHPRPIVTMEH